MEILEKAEPAIIFLAILLGLGLSNIPLLTSNSGSLITLFLCLMLYGLFLEVPLKDLKNSFKNVKFTSASLIINFIWTPLLGYFLGALFLKGNIDILIGFFMLILTPCTDWYLVFTKMAKGNLNLSFSILPINLILQIVLLPIYLIIFFSTSNSMNYYELTYSILIVIVIPFILAQLTKYILKNKTKINEKITQLFSKYQTIFLAIAVFGIFNSEGRVVFNNLNSILLIFIPLILFFIINFILDFIVAKNMKFNYENYASLTMTTLARNSPLALAIAVNSFPESQLILIGLVIGPLIELPVLYGISQLLLAVKKRY